jgi:hypothetical protein
MQKSRRKSNPETTEGALAGARTGRDDLIAQEARLAADMDAALIDNDKGAVDRIEAEAADVRKQRERADRRIALLEQKAAEEMRQRQERAQADLLARVEAKFRERDEAVVEMCGHMGAMIVAFRKATAANGAAAAGWPFSPGDIQAAMFGQPLQRAIAIELYRLTGSPYHNGDAGRSFEFPGAQMEDIRNPQPGIIRPLTEKVAEASAYAVGRMRTAPMRAMAITTPRADSPLSAPSIPAYAAETAPAPQPAEPAPLPEYCFDVDLVQPATGEIQTVRVVFSSEDVADSYLDGIGPMGARGREIAMRRAEEHAPVGFVFDGRKEALRFDLRALERSMGEAA